MSSGRPSPWASRREGARSLATLVGLSAISVAAPVLDVLGSSPEVFVFNGASAGTIVVFGLVVVLGPPALGFLIETAAGYVRPRSRPWVHLGLVGLLVATGVAQILHGLVSVPALVTLLAVGAGVTVALGYRTWPALRTWSRYLAATAPVLLALFLFASPVAVLVSGSPAVVEGTVTSETPVVIVVLDELPLSTMLTTGGDLDAEMFPHLAEFAADATWYRNATTTHGLTLDAVPGILSGQDVGFENRSPLWSDYPDNVFTLFGGAYDMNVSETLTQLCPPSACTDSDRRPAAGGLADLLGDAASVWRDRVTGAGPRPDAIEQFVESVIERPASSPAPVFDRDEDRGTASPARLEDFLDGLDGLPSRSLSMIHLVLPHAPWTFLPGGQSYPDPPLADVGFLNGWPERSDAPALLGRQRHVLQTQYVDGLIGGVMERLDDVGLYDDAVIAVVADHGANLTTAGNYRAAAEDNYEQIMWVPLLVKAPGQQQGQVDDRHATTLDVLPTIAELAGVPVPFEVDGVSLVDPERPVDRTADFYQVREPPLLDVTEELLRPSVETGSERVRASAFPSDRRGDPEWWPYQVGEHSRLVGAPLDDLDRQGGSSGAVELDEHVIDVWSEVDPEAPTVPAIVSGRVDLEAGEWVAVVVNGRVAAVSETFPALDGSIRFGAVSPPSLLRAGDNDLAFFVVSEESPVTLRTLSTG